MKRAVWIGLACALVACISVPGAYEVRGSCRDGLPDGPYTLLTPTGVTLARGAFAAGRREGMFQFSRTTSELIGELPYRAGRVDGLVRLWFSPQSTDGRMGVLKLEAEYSGGVRDGASRGWYADGKPRAEYAYARGSLLAAQTWDRAGTLQAAGDSRARARADEAADSILYDAFDDMVEENPIRCPR